MPEQQRSKFRLFLEYFLGTLYGWLKPMQCVHFMISAILIIQAFVCIVQTHINAMYAIFESWSLNKYGLFAIFVLYVIALWFLYATPVNIMDSVISSYPRCIALLDNYIINTKIRWLMRNDNNPIVLSAELLPEPMPEYKHERQWINKLKDFIAYLMIFGGFLFLVLYMIFAALLTASKTVYVIITYMLSVGAALQMIYVLINCKFIKYMFKTDQKPQNNQQPPNDKNNQFPAEIPNQNAEAEVDIQQECQASDTIITIIQQNGDTPKTASCICKKKIIKDDNEDEESPLLANSEFPPNLQKNDKKKLMTVQESVTRTKEIRIVLDQSKNSVDKLKYDEESSDAITSKTVHEKREKLVYFPFYTSLRNWYQNICKCCKNTKIYCINNSNNNSKRINKMCHNNKGQELWLTIASILICIITLAAIGFSLGYVTQAGLVLLIHTVIYYIMSFENIDLNYPHRRNQNRHTAAKILWVIQVVLSVVFIVGGIWVMPKRQQQNVMSSIKYDANYTANYSKQSILCANDNYNLSLHDYAVLARISYLNGKTGSKDLQHFTNFQYKSNYMILFQRNISVAVIVPCSFSGNASPVPNINSSMVPIVSFRGTDSDLDLYHDIQIFFPQTFLDLTGALLLSNVIDNWIMNVFNRVYNFFGADAFSGAFTLSNQTMTFMNNLVRNQQQFTESYYFNGSVVVNNSNSHPIYYQLPINQSATNFITVGHSLGGGMAKLAATQLNVPVVSISGPGIYYNISEKQLPFVSSQIRNVIPRTDVIPMIGKQEGAVINIPCNPKYTWNNTNAMNGCHSIATTQRMLSLICNINDTEKDETVTN